MNLPGPGRPPFGRAAVALVLLSLVAGCALAGQGSTSQPEEHMSAFASIWLTGEPAVADRTLEVELRDQDDAAFTQVETFEPGVIVRTSFGVSAGPYRLVGQDGSCGLDLVLGPELESDVVFRIDATGGCAFERIREHGPELSHESSGTLVATIAAEHGGQLLVEVRSLDTPANPIPDAVPPDEGDLAIIQPLWPGRYEVRLLRDGTPIETRELTITSKPSGDRVEITLDGQPG